MVGQFAQAWDRIVQRAPLAPCAVAFSLGIFLGEWTTLPVWAGLVPALFFLGLIWRLPGWRVALVLPALVFLGQAWRADAIQVGANGLARIATQTPVPCRLEGVVVDGPWLLDPPLGLAGNERWAQGAKRAEFIVLAESMWVEGFWRPISGRVRVTRELSFAEAFPGRKLQMLGLLKAISAPMNPGEIDLRTLALKQGIQAELRLEGTQNEDGSPADMTLVSNWSWRPECWLAAMRVWGAERLRKSVEPDVAELAAALVLGDTRQVDRPDWLLFQRTGVVHVLAISGQHLVLVAWACFLLGRVLGFRTRQVVLVVAILVLIYALVTGGRPPALRAAITVLSAAVAWLSRRPPSFVNCLALSWLVVAILMPADLGSTGCLLSFFATGLLHWATRSWWREQTEEEEAYERAVELSRPGWISWLIGRGREVGEAYRVNLIVWLGLTPLVAARTYMVSLVAVVVGPPVAFLGGWALGFGFLLLLAGPNLPMISALLSLGTTWALRGCRWLAWWGESLPGAWFSTPGLGVFWLVIFHLVLTGGLVGLWPNIRWRLVIGLAISFVLFPLLPMKQWLNPVQPGWRCAFLAVGHGSCVVLELTDASGGRRVVVMDVGAVSGDGVTRRIVEPYLRHRGISMVDDLVISHADLDHYAGALELADRVRVKKVWVGPGFAEKRNESTAILLEGLKQRRLSPALLHAGLALRWGETEIRVLHPPADLPGVSAEKSNEASLVLRIDSPWGGVLLPGDLEGQGTRRLLASNPQPVEVLLAPHHGSRKALAPALLEALKPSLLVAQQGPRDAALPVGPFTAWSTREMGAVEVECKKSGGQAVAYTTGEVMEWLPN